jgi:membrane associated rhomboid family serine protease
MANGLSLERMPEVPATALLVIGSLGVTARAFLQNDYDPWVLDVRAFHGEPWRVLTSALPHGNVLHIAFNLYWTWHLGSRVEERYGTPQALGLFAFVQVVALCAEYAVLDGGIGLSGVGYGLVTFLFVRSSRDRRLADTVDEGTLRSFALWFVFCVILTVTGTKAIANVAHGMGAVAGAVLGFAADAGKTPRSRESIAAVAGAVALVLLTVAGCTVARPYVNFSSQPGVDAAYHGYLAHKDGRLDEAVALYRTAVAMDDHNAEAWWNLGLAEGALGHAGAAQDAMGKAIALEPEKFSDPAKLR